VLHPSPRLARTVRRLSSTKSTGMPFLDVASRSLRPSWSTARTMRILPLADLWKGWCVHGMPKTLRRKTNPIEPTGLFGPGLIVKGSSSSVPFDFVVVGSIAIGRIGVLENTFSVPLGVGFSSLPTVVAGKKCDQAHPVDQNA